MFHFNLDNVPFAQSYGRGSSLLALLVLGAGVSLSFARRSGAAVLWFSFAATLLVVWGIPWCIATDTRLFPIALMFSPFVLGLYKSRTWTAVLIKGMFVLVLATLCGRLEYAKYEMERERTLQAKTRARNTQEELAARSERFADLLSDTGKRLEADAQAKRESGQGRPPKDANEVVGQVRQLAEWAHRSVAMRNAVDAALDAGKVDWNTWVKIYDQAQGVENVLSDRLEALGFRVDYAGPSIQIEPNETLPPAPPDPQLAPATNANFPGPDWEAEIRDGNPNALNGLEICILVTPALVTSVIGLWLRRGRSRPSD